jgi:predicted Zn-dependent protease
VPPDKARLRFLLFLMAALALVSTGVNFRRWQQRARSAAGAATGTAHTSGGRPNSPTPDLVALQVEEARQATLAHPEDDAARLAFARLLFLARRFAEAGEQLTLLQSHQPRRPEIAYWLSLVQKQRGQLDAALTSIQRARRLEPHSERFGEQLGEIYLAQGRGAEAACVFDSCLTQQPDAYAALMGKARAMEQLYQEKLPVAIPEIVTPVRKAVRLQPQNAWGITVLARMSFAYLQQFAAAEQMANQAIRLDPGQAEPYLILVEIYLADPARANTEKAVACARQAVRLDPHSPQPLYLLGRTLLRQNDLLGAIDALKQSTRVKLMPEAVYQLSLAYARAGKPAQARYYSQLYDSWTRFSERRKLLLTLLEHRPRDVQLHVQLAELYLAQGAVEPAHNWLRRGLQLQPHDSRLHGLLARANLPAEGSEHEGTNTQRTQGRGKSE